MFLACPVARDPSAVVILGAALDRSTAVPPRRHGSAVPTSNACPSHLPGLHSSLLIPTFDKPPGQSKKMDRGYVISLSTSPWWRDMAIKMRPTAILPFSLLSLLSSPKVNFTLLASCPTLDFGRPFFQNLSTTLCALCRPSLIPNKLYSQHHLFTTPSRCVSLPPLLWPLAPWPPWSLMFLPPTPLSWSPSPLAVLRSPTALPAALTSPRPSFL